MPKISGDDATYHLDEGQEVPENLPNNVRLVGPGAPNDEQAEKKAQKALPPSEGNKSTSSSSTSSSSSDKK